MEVAYEMCRYKKAGMKIWGNEIKRSYEKDNYNIWLSLSIA